MADRGWSSTIHQDGDGSQYNALNGGAQNINTGNGIQLTGAIIHNASFTNSSGFQCSQQQLCLQSLAFLEMESRSKDVDTATTGTCEWLLGHSKYKTWKQSKRGLLWIKGKPGSGKSTLLRHALNSIQVDKGRGSAIVLSFFFHGRGVELQRTPLGLFRSLLHQLLSHVPDALLILIATFEERCKNMGTPGEKWQWHLNDLRDLFRSSIPKVLESRPIWLFIDALDECGKKNAIDLVEEFKTLFEGLPDTGSYARICFTCRHYPIVYFNSGLEICLEDENGQDISTYVHARLGPSIPDSIHEMIKKRASGVFMWVRLVSDRVLDLEQEKMGRKKIEDEIHNIPPDLDHLYQGLIERMDDKETSLKLIRWVCFATRPLSLGELRWAMILDSEIFDDNHPHQRQSLQRYEVADDCASDDDYKTRIRALSCGLADVITSSRKEVVQFIHQSVKDYFIDKGISTLSQSSKSEAPNSNVEGHAHYQLSRICINYLAMEEIGRSISKERDDITSGFQTSRKFPFLQYAATSWVAHTKQSEIRGVPQDDLLSYFDWPSEELVQRWVRIYRMLYRYSPHCPLEGATMIHIVSRHQLMGPLRVIIRRANQAGIDIDTSDSNGQTPLLWAAENGHENIVRLLLSTGKANINTRDSSGRTPLLWAARSGHENVARLLLSTGKANIDIRDRYGQTPLLWAARSGHENVVRLLLGAGADEADIDAKDNGRGWALLTWAARNPRKVLAKLAPARLHFDTGKAGIDAKNSKGQTPLWWAVENGHEAIVNLLLATGKFDLNAKSAMFNEAPLLGAVRNGHEAIVRLLLATDKVDVNAKGDYGLTPLLCAVGVGHEAIVNLLLATGKVDVNAKDAPFSQTPLSCAVEAGDEAIARLLLATGKADINAKDSIGRTPLFYAAIRGHETIAMLLLSHDSVDIDPEDHYGSTPLSIAVRHSHFEVVKILLATTRVALNSQDRFGRTLWWWARKCGSTDVKQALLDYAQKNGILVCDNDESSGVGFAPEDATDEWCDICTLGISVDEIFYRCEICYGGDFSVCLECHNIGGHCLIEHHELDRRDGGDDESQ